MKRLLKPELSLTLFETIIKITQNDSFKIYSNI